MLEAPQTDSCGGIAVLCGSDQHQTSAPESIKSGDRVQSASLAEVVPTALNSSRSPSHDDGIASSSSEDEHRTKRIKSCHHEGVSIAYGIGCVTIKIYENSEWWNRVNPLNLGPLAEDLHRKTAMKDPLEHRQSICHKQPRIIPTRSSSTEIPETLRHVFEMSREGMVEMKSPFIRWWNKLADAANEDWIVSRRLQGNSGTAIVMQRNADLNPPRFHDLKVAAWNFLRRLVCKGVPRRELIFAKGQINNKVDGSFVKLLCILAKRSRTRGFKEACLDFPMVCERDGSRYRTRCWFCFRLLTIVRWTEKKTVWNQLSDHLLNQHDQTEKLRNLVRDPGVGTAMFSLFDYLVALQHSSAELYVLRRALEVEGQQLHFDEDPPNM